jgi:hypothetical protein
VGSDLPLVEVIVFLSFVSFVFQIAAWWWVHRLHQRLSGRDGDVLVGIVDLLLGWSVFLRVVGTVGTVYSAVVMEPLIAGVTIVASQIFFLVIVTEAIRRLVRLMKS